MLPVMLIFPKRMRVAHRAQGLPDLQHCRVRRQHVECLAWRGRGEGDLYGLLAVGDYWANRKLGVLEAHGHVIGPDAADGERHGIRFALLPRVGEHLEVHVPEPGDVASVGVIVVYGDEDVFGVGARDEGPQDLVKPHRVLYEQQEGLSVPRLYPLDPPEGSPELTEAAGDLSEPDPGLPGHRGSGEGVVDIVDRGVLASRSPRPSGSRAGTPTPGLLGATPCSHGRLAPAVRNRSGDSRRGRRVPYIRSRRRGPSRTRDRPSSQRRAEGARYPKKARPPRRTLVAWRTARGSRRGGRPRSGPPRRSVAGHRRTRL